MKLTNYDKYIIYNLLLTKLYRFNLIDRFPYFATETSNMIKWIEQYNSLNHYIFKNDVEEDYIIFKQISKDIMDLTNNVKIK